MNTYRFLKVLAVALILVIAPAAYAAHVETGKSVSIPVTQSISDNAYLAGGQIVFSTTAQKDLVAAGGQVTVNGPVWGDALLAGGMVQVLEQVRGDVRAAGGQVTIGSGVSGDVIVMGGEVRILPGVVIGGDVIAAGGSVNIEGAVNGGLRAYGGDIVVNGAIAGPVSIKAGKSVTFGEKTVLGNILMYWAPKEATVAEGAKLGDEVTFLNQNPDESRIPALAPFAFAILGTLFLIKFFGTLVAALVLVLVFGKFSKTLVASSLEGFWKTAGIGFIALAVTPILVIVLGMTVLGLYIALALAFLYLLCLIIAGALMCVLAGALLSKWIRKEPVVDWKWTVLGTLAVFVVFFVPFLGWIADSLLFLIAFGAMTKSVIADAEAKMRD
ncbi:MAG: hypothetical protein Q7R74_00195 [bacterium]|nr:hypothetical protein [bacterium]